MAFRQDKQTLSWCDKLSRWGLVLVILMAFLFSLTALASCEMFSWERQRSQEWDHPVDSLMDDDDLSVDLDASVRVVDTATFGLINWNPEDTGCRRYENKDELSPAFVVARVGGVGASFFSLVSLLLIIAEFILCRFACSRCLTVVCFLITVICEAASFSVYVSDVCLQPSTPYACDFERGTWLAVAAVILLLVSATAVCAVPKARPLIRVLMELDRANDENDPCCYCWRKDLLNASTEEDDDDEETPDDFRDADRDFVGQEVLVHTDSDDYCGPGSAADRKIPDVLSSPATAAYGYRAPAKAAPAAAAVSAASPKLYDQLEGATFSNARKSRLYQNGVVIENDLFFDSKTL